MKMIIALAIITSLAASGTAFARDGSGGAGGGGGAGDGNGKEHSMVLMGTKRSKAFSVFMKPPGEYLEGESQDAAPNPPPSPPPSQNDDCMACP